MLIWGSRTFHVNQVEICYFKEVTMKPLLLWIKKKSQITWKFVFFPKKKKCKNLQGILFKIRKLTISISGRTGYDSMAIILILDHNVIPHEPNFQLRIQISFRLTPTVQLPIKQTPCIVGNFQTHTIYAYIHHCFRRSNATKVM